LHISWKLITLCFLKNRNDSNIEGYNYSNFRQNTVSVLESFEHALMHFILFNLTVMTCAIYRKVRKHVTVYVVDVSPNSFRDEISNMVKISIFYKNNMCESETFK